jgi:hypothetical protein
MALSLGGVERLRWTATGQSGSALQAITWPNQFKILNGDFSVNQGGVASGDAASNALGMPPPGSFAGGSGDTGADRWFPIRHAVGGNATFARTSNTSAIGHLVPRSYYTLTSTVQGLAGDYVVLLQRIESAGTYSGQTITLFQWLKRATAGNIAVSIRQHFGTGGSPSADVTTYIGQLTLTTSFAPYKLVVAVPSVAGKTFGTNNNDYLEIVYWISAGSTYNATTGSLGLANTTVDFYGIHERAGDAPIEAINYYQPPDLQVELARCMRYYQNLTQVGRVSGAAPSIGQIAFPVAMRATPSETITYNTGSGATWAVSRTGMVQTSNHSGNASVTQLILDAEL